ncbi:DUF4266 domain-containing protein [Methyloversatilis discipulorum]|uniref:DUF4266 domain-containing protein n=1 Tax=Methyloversatilis discipulorum TaxID=1119528 RepID=UPI001A494429|nr:DUF4266 domain-containing protein [Methyloversatilis discipulorum]MBL8469594.1 DUF4266 domain-containing protein [Methyloversatilis discipulorum]
MKVVSMSRRGMLFFSLVLMLSGCADVAVWERGDLARPDMALEPQPIQRAIHEHVYSSREAGSAGAAGQGGGCGCY